MLFYCHRQASSKVIKEDYFSAGRRKINNPEKISASSAKTKTLHKFYYGITQTLKMIYFILKKKVMHKASLTPILFISLLVSSCNRSTPTRSDTPAKTGSSQLPPVETRKPNTDYKPAFTGQTRISGVKTETPFEGVVLSSGLNRPWGITSLPDGRLLITEKGGNMRIASTSGSLSSVISGLPKVNPSGQGGLLGLTLDPSFAENRMVYWSFSEPLPEGNLTSVAKGKLSDDDSRMENVTVIYRATPAYKGDLHYGSRILFDKEGNLIFSTGERSDLVTRPQAQDLNSGLGKIIRITKDGKPAAGNPFLNKQGARPEIYSYGHRNVQGLAFHPETGDLWEDEFGPRGGDELNLIQPGKNYGWPTITYGIEYAGDKIGNAITQKEGLEQPVYYWDPVVSPSGMTFYSGNKIPEWKNSLFIAGLNSNHIVRLVIDNNKVVGEERLLSDQGQRFRDITQGKDGALYAVTDEGRLYRIAKK
jgi:aldose sugar dehydrogenase